MSRPKDRAREDHLGFGFGPLLAYPDCPDSPARWMPLAGLLRPGNAGANDAADQITVPCDALEQLPRELAATETIVMRTDSAGVTHELLDFCRDGQIRYTGFLISPSPAVRGPVSPFTSPPRTVALHRDPFRLPHRLGQASVFTRRRATPARDDTEESKPPADHARSRTGIR